MWKGSKCGGDVSSVRIAKPNEKKKATKKIN